MIAQILLVFALVFAIIAAVFVERVDRSPFGIHFGWLAFAFYIASILFGKY